MSKKKCPRCGRISMSMINCTHCNADMLMKRVKNVNYDPVSGVTFCSCGQRGREVSGISLRQAEAEYLCFDCYHRRKYQLDHLSMDKSLAGISANIYERALKEFYLKPLYYGDRPNIEMLEIAAEINIGTASPEKYNKLKIAFPDIVQHG